MLKKMTVKKQSTFEDYKVEIIQTKIEYLTKRYLIVIAQKAKNFLP